VAVRATVTRGPGFEHPPGWELSYNRLWRLDASLVCVNICVFGLADVFSARKSHDVRSGSLHHYNLRTAVLGCLEEWEWENERKPCRTLRLISSTTVTIRKTTYNPSRRGGEWLQAIYVVILLSVRPTCYRLT
jgi:hypothetical protein